MPKITLHGNPEGSRTYQIPPTQSTSSLPFTDEGIHRRGCFAMVDALGVHADTFWAAIKRHYQVKSRAELTPQQWATLCAEMNASRNNQTLKVSFLKRIGYTYILHTSRVISVRDDKMELLWEGELTEKVMVAALKRHQRGETVRVAYKNFMLTLADTQDWEQESPRFFYLKREKKNLTWIEFHPHPEALTTVGGCRNYATLHAIRTHTDIQVTDRHGHTVKFEVTL